MDRDPGTGKNVPFGPFVLERRLAVGGSAEVFVARPKSGLIPAPRLVVKRLLGPGKEDAEFDLLDREAELHRAVTHPNVVTVFGAGMVGSEPYLAMEYVEGVDLYRLLRHAESEQRALPPALAVYVTREVAAALGAVHDARDATGEPLGIVHRDVTPSNVYLSKHGDAKLGDFGIARVSERHRAPSGDPGLKGKFGYFAPEQIAGEPFDHRADLFALAAILGEMLIGERIFPGSGQLAVLLAIRDVNYAPLRDRAGRLPTGLYAVLERALARDPDARYPTALDFSTALEPFEKPDPATLRKELAKWVSGASDEKRLARQIRDSVQRMRAVALRSSVPMDGPASVPPVAPSEPAPAIAVVPQSPLPTRPDAQRAPLTLPATPVDDDAVIRTVNRTGTQKVPFAVLMEMLSTGALTADDEVAILGDDFKKIGDLPDLARHLLPSTTVTSTTKGASQPGAPDYKATLAEIPMGAVLARMRQERETGALFVERTDTAGKAQRKEIYLQAGRLHHVASSDRTELLGEYLVRRNVLTREQLDAALSKLSQFGGRLGDTLIFCGYVEAVDVFRAIRDQGRDRVAALYGWTRGIASFYRGTEPGHVEFPLDLDLSSPMMAGAIVKSDGDPRRLLPADDVSLEPGPRHYLAFDPAEVGTAPSSLRALPKLAADRVSVGEALARLTAPGAERSGRQIGLKEACAALVAAQALGWVEF